MVGRLTLDQSIEVQILVPEPVYKMIKLIIKRILYGILVTIGIVIIVILISFIPNLIFIIAVILIFYVLGMIVEDELKERKSLK